MFGIRAWYIQYTNVELLTILPLKTLSSKNVAIKMLKTLILNQASINSVGNEKYMLSKEITIETVATVNSNYY